MRFMTIPFLLAGFALMGCGAPEVSVETGTAPIVALELTTDPEKVFCPEGTTFLASHRLCVDDKDAVGPFTPTMVDKCIKYGGGEKVCRGERWAKSFAMKIRGTGRCMLGSTYDAKTGECLSGDEAFGPFSKEIVERCKSKKGGPACETMRVHKHFVTVTADPYQGSRNYIRITRQNWYLYGGLYALKMELLSPDSAPIASMWAISGQDYAQYFRKAERSQTGSYEPLPEGLWRVRYPDRGTAGNEWMGGVGNYDSWISDGLGPTFQEIVMYPGYETERSAIGIHLDGNRSSAPGTAGCVGIPSMSELKRYISWFQNAEMAPQTFVVDWGLGTIPSTFSLAAKMRSLTNFGLQDAYVPLMERVNLIEQER